MTTIHDAVYHPEPKMVIVPQSLLDELEASRRELYSINPEMTIAEQIQMQNITEVMWKLANRKWKEVK